jgi:hypothetical protein
MKKEFVLYLYRGDLTTSIICEYSRRDIDSILDGNFKEADSTGFWRELPRDHVPDGVPKNVKFAFILTVATGTYSFEIYSDFLIDFYAFWDKSHAVPQCIIRTCSVCAMKY